MFTPMNIAKKCTFNRSGFSERPVNRGNQWAIPAKMANTAPMDNT